MAFKKHPVHIFKKKDHVDVLTIVRLKFEKKDRLSYQKSYLRVKVFLDFWYLPFLFHKHFFQMNIRKNIETHRI